MSRFRAWFVSKPLFFTYHWLRRDGVLSAIRLLEESQWFDAPRLEALQHEKLYRLLQHSARHVPYYRELFNSEGIGLEDFGKPEEFRKIPMLTKAMIRANRMALISEQATAHDLIPNSTGGSTGEPLRFFNDRRAIAWQQAVVWRNQQWVGMYYSDREARLWGAMIDVNRASMFRERMHGWLHQKLLLSAYDLSDESMASYAERLRKFKPRLLISYPGPLATFCKFLEQRGIVIVGLQAVIMSAEQLHDWQRELIERVLSAPVFDRYGCREFGNIAHECSFHQGYHVNSERFLVEILDENCRPVGVGQTGGVFITDLDNYAFPFIRYAMGDRAVRSDRICSCGRGLPLIAHFEGRVMEVVECPNGNRLGGTFFTIILRHSLPALLRFQVEQLQRDLMVVRLVMPSDVIPSEEEAVLAAIREKCGSEMKVRIEYVDEIPLTGSGKEKLVIAPQFE